MNITIWKGLETFAIGLAVVIVSSIIQALTNYHPTGQEGMWWGVVGVGVIGAFRALLSWLIIKQGTPATPPVSGTSATTTPTTGASS